MLKKKNKNKKVDIYTALMLPLMTMFLLNIGLVATTWAWYTASVSSGVNTITAGPKVDIKVTIEGNANTVEPDVNGDYTLSKNQTYNLEITPGNAETGYLVLMDITDLQQTSASLFDLFITNAYAEEIPSKYYVAIPHQPEQCTVEVTLKTPDENKSLKLKKLWLEKTGEAISNPEVNAYIQIIDGMINLIPAKKSYTINLIKEDGTPLKQSEVTNGVSTYSDNTEEDLDAVITVEDTEETEITMPSFDGYELISVNGEDPKESYLLTEGQENEFNAVYKKIETTEREELITGSGQEENAVSDNESLESEIAVVEIPAQTESPVESTTQISGSESTETQVSPESILETPEGQETVNTEPVQPATVPQEQQQNELSEEETAINDVPVAQSEETALEENTEVVDDAQSESGD